LADLLRSRGRSAVVVGPRQPPAAHHLAHWLNERLGNAGQTVWYTAGPDSERPGHVEAIKALVRELNAGAVNTLLILGGNPVFNAPADLNFAEALHRVENTMHLGLYVNETSRAADWRLPRAHFLESWGDARAYDGTLCLVQPLIEPLHGGKPALELLARLTDDDYYRGYDLVRRALRQFVGDGDFEKQWRQALHDGFLRGSRWAIEKPAPKAPDAASLDAIQISRGEAGSDELEVVFCRDSKLHDGRFSNNGWLQELPDPLTRLTWGNAALMSPATARSLGVRGEQLIGILRGERAVELPVLVLPGMAAGTVAVALGYGGVVGTGSGEKDGTDAAGVGSNAYPLRTSDAMGFVPGVRITAAGRSCTLALAELRDSLDAAGRATRAKLAASLARRITLQQYRDGAGAGRGTPAATRPAWLWEERQYPGHRWGMAIDLSLCTGCGACVVACQAENNIPVVGSQEVRLGREMHWLRVDRYFAGSGDSVSVLYQPVACQHCELAPCEQVCPVGATVHDAEGLNGMVYNRCIGCRYCSNNCPYKARRFNFFDNFREIGRDRRQQVRKLGLNPEVTIRSRGVMEKCTYCVQRIQWAKIRAKNEGRTVRDGQIVPACAQACPAGAIIFGDLNDPGSAVAGLRAGARSYALLADLNVRPRTTYLERVTNPNPRLGQADEPVSGGEGG
jgi:molybdopterin-containing oxidoreductase family iron-sulfur binding subunit